VNAIVVGAGRLGTQIAHALAGSGRPVTLVDTDRGVVDRPLAREGIRPVAGDGCEPAVLERAGALAADLLVAATGDDEDNLVIALLAKRQFGVERVVSRVNDADNAWLFDERWGVDVALPSAGPLIALIEEAAGSFDTVSLLRLARAGVTLIETALGTGSSAAGRAVREVRIPTGCVVAAVVRDGQPVVPTPDFVLADGDELLVVAQTATATDIHAAFQ
jgi:trk system potassium uptake protein TrkA